MLTFVIFGQVRRVVSRDLPTFVSGFITLFSPAAMRMLLCRCALPVLLGGAAGASPAWAQGPKPRPALPVPYQAVDARMRLVPDSSARTVGGLARYIAAAFPLEADRARAAFGWVARNIRYDVDNMFVLEYEREPAAVVQETMDKRLGVCRHYAELYSTLANRAGVLTYVVPGYTSLRDPVGHAWCASRIEGQWYLMDPTWAAGRVVQDKFTFRLNDEYFKVKPAVFIETHMPFDPLWQLLPAPRTPQQFQLGLKPAAPGPPFAFADSVAAYSRQTPAQQLRATARRIQQNGVKNGLTYNFLISNRQHEGNLFIEAYNDALNAYNAGIGELNDFIGYFNHQFLPRKTDEELRQLLAPLAADLTRSRQLLAAALPTTAAQQVSLTDFQASLQQVEIKLADGHSFIERYLRTTKILRLMLFANPEATKSLTR